MTEPAAPPVLDLYLPKFIEWHQHRPGGCRCACAAYHPGAITHHGPGSGVCIAAAHPGHLLRVLTPDTTSDPLPVCADCYHHITTHPKTRRQ